MKKADQEKIEKFQPVLAKHKLFPVGDQLYSLSARFFSFKAENQKGDKFWIKIVRNKKSISIRKELIREIKVLKKVDQALNNSRQTLNSLEFIAGQTNKYPEWLIYKFAPGRESGDILTGYAPSFLTPTNLKKINSTFKIIHNIKTNHIDLPVKKFSWYEKNINNYLKNLPRTIKLNKNLLSASQLYLKQNKQKINNSPLVLNHGDLFPQNFLNYKKHYTIIDWGSAHLNNPGFDLANIWFNARRRKKWQKNFLATIPMVNLPGFTATAIWLTLHTMHNYGQIYDHPEKWDNYFPYYRKKYYTKMRPRIKASWADHVQNLEDLLAK